MKTNAKKLHNYFGENLLSSIGSSLTDLQPLASTMSDGLKAAGISPPSELNALADSFNKNIVAPVSGTLGGSNVGGNILDYISKQVTAFSNGQSLSKVNSVIGQGGLDTIGKLSFQQRLGNIFSSPLTWVIVVVLVGVALMVFKRS